MVVVYQSTLCHGIRLCPYDNVDNYGRLPSPAKHALVKEIEYFQMFPTKFLVGFQVLRYCYTYIAILSNLTWDVDVASNQ